MTTRKRTRGIDQDVEKYIVHLVAQNWDKERNLAAFVSQELSDVDGFKERIPENRTLQRRVREMKAPYEGSSDYVRVLDRPFEWHRLEEYKLPWEAGSFLLALWQEVRELGAILRTLGWFQGTEEQLPSVRQATWWWRVHLAVPEMETKMNVYFWAEEFCRLELYQDVLGKPMDTAGIEAYLAYKPWADQANLDAYTAAGIDGRIPWIPTLFDEFVELEGDTFDKVKPRSKLSARVYGFLGMLPGGLDPQKPGQLPVELMREIILMLYDFKLSLKDSEIHELTSKLEQLNNTPLEGSE